LKLPKQLLRKPSVHSFDPLQLILRSFRQAPLKNEMIVLYQSTRLLRVYVDVFIALAQLAYAVYRTRKE
jgi:hypothetical protein